MRSRRLLVLAALAAALPLASVTSCGGEDVTEAQFIDHALEISTAASTDEQRDYLRKIFECVWPEIRKDEGLLGDFMDATASSPELSDAVSPMMADCYKAATPAG